MSFKDDILKLVPEKELKEWLSRNPPPPIWKFDEYAWAMFEMPVGKFATWWRKHILHWDI